MPLTLKFNKMDFYRKIVSSVVKLFVQNDIEEFNLQGANIAGQGLVIANTTVYDSGAGALPITSEVIFLETGGAEAFTLPDGVEGQRLIIIMTVDGGDGTVTPANYLNGTTFTLDDVGDSADLIFDGTNWCNVGTPTATVA